MGQNWNVSRGGSCRAGRLSPKTWALAAPSGQISGDGMRREDFSTVNIISHGWHRLQEGVLKINVRNKYKTLGNCKRSF